MSTLDILTAIGGTLGFCSAVMEIWYFISAFLFKLNSPLQKLIFLGLLTHFITICFFVAAFTANNCKVYWLAIQFWTVADWIPSTCIALNMIVILFWKMNQNKFRKLQYVYYAVTFAIPLTFTIAVFKYTEFKEGESVALCYSYNPVISHAFVFVLPFFITLSLSFSCLIAVLVKLQKNFQTFQTNKRKASYFYSLLSIVIGLWRAPAVIFVIYWANQKEPPDWANGIALFFTDSEGLVVAIAVFWYFDILSLWKSKAWKDSQRTNGEDFLKPSGSGVSLTTELP